ncbi:MAG: adenylate/guanylate cyclase domain-containing protein [Planctomycetia bacterium]
MSIPTPPLAAAEAVPSVRHRVLVVDDQALVGTRVRQMLADQADMEVHFRQTAEAAIEAGAALHPTVILQDLVMPDVTGAEMVRRFRALPETAIVPVIVLSAVEEPATKAELLAGGASDYLVKLPDPVELAARVRLHSEGHARLLERNAAFAALERANVELARERERSDRLLHAILPDAIAERLKSGPQSIAEMHSEVTVLFADMCGFTELTGRIGPREVVDLLDEIFGCFDRLAVKHGVEKIKTIGDAWMAVSGLPEPRADHAVAMASLSLDLLSEFEALAARRGLSATLRVGMHSGPVVAGVIGRDRFAYDLWGDTVNMASRMESHGEPGRIQVSADTAALLADGFVLEDRGEIAVKGKGQVRSAFLAGVAPGRGVASGS